jgi:hypothetical protein
MGSSTDCPTFTTEPLARLVNGWPQNRINRLIPQELSETNSGFVQRIVRENPEALGYALTNDAKGRWYTIISAATSPVVSVRRYWGFAPTSR